MDNELHVAVDHYLSDLFIAPDPVLEQGLADSRAAELPEIAVSSNQGKFLSLLARSMRARRILEIGTLGGYSAIWLARALPAAGRLITLEFEPVHADVARHNLRRAGFESQVEVRVGPAAESLKRMISEGEEPFDFVFIDADKESYSEYLDLVLSLSKSGTLIVADNVVRNGEVINSSSEDPLVLGVRKFCLKLAGDPRLDATAMQTVGSKGYDGFAMAVVK